MCIKRKPIIYSIDSRHHILTIHPYRHSPVLAENDSSPSVDDSHMALNHMPKQSALRRLPLSASFPFPFT